VALDSKGAVYIADALNNRVVVETPSGTTYKQTVLPATGLSAPSGVAVDNSGNVFIADSFNNRIVELALSGTTYTQSVIVSTGLSNPTHISIFATSLLIAATLNNRIAEATYNATSESYIVNTVSTGTLNSPVGVAADTYGDLFIADTKNQRMAEDSLSLNTHFGPWPVGQKPAANTVHFGRGYRLGCLGSKLRIHRQQPAKQCPQ